MPGLAMHRSKAPFTCSLPNSTRAPSERRPSAKAQASSPGAPAITHSSCTRPPRSGARYPAAARPLLPSPKTSTRPKLSGACFRPSMRARAAIMPPP